MKKLLLVLIYFVFTGAMVNSQVNEIQYAKISSNEISQMIPDTNAGSEKIRLDSTNAEDFNNSVWEVANILNGYAQFIPGIPNVILQTVTGIIIALIVRRMEKRALRKKGVLNDIKG